MKNGIFVVFFISLVFIVGKIVNWGRVIYLGVKLFFEFWLFGYFIFLFERVNFNLKENNYEILMCVCIYL